MTQLHALLGGLADEVLPPPDALDRLRSSVARRGRRRRAAGLASAVVLVMALAAMGLQGASAGTRALTGSTASRALRHSLGIVGTTKGAPRSVLVSSVHEGRSNAALVQVATGRTRPLAIRVDGASLSPGGDVVAGVDRDRLVVVNPSDGGTPRPVTTEGGGPPRGLSWDRGGSALFALVQGRWVRVSNPGRSGAESVRTLEVPVIPGGPILLSPAPSGDEILLFGLIPPAGPRGRVVPHLELGRFDGTTVWGLHPVDAPASAVDGPMGWVGDNAFLLASGPGRALIVRTDGKRVEVRVHGLANPCVLPRSPSGCTAAGPDLLGTNGDGSLLFWKLTVRAAGASHRFLRAVYYETWLDGTHTLRLTGVLSRVGPPVAGR